MRKKYQKRAVSLKCTQAIIFARVSSKRQKDEGTPSFISSKLVIFTPLLQDICPMVIRCM